VFFRTLRSWTSTRAGTAVTTADFIALAEQESGRDLDALFQAWLYTAGKPAR
jgi:aminopeptidase N